jgi:tRNA dimethylallyltransferase
MRNKLIVLIGPTGVGKTELSLSLAEFLHTPVINADSRQLYKDLTIGTAAPTADQLKRVKHYFVGTLSLTDYYSAAQFESDVISLLDQLYQTHPFALMSGGSMMYIDAVCNGIDDIPTVDQETREMIMERYQQEGLTPLSNELRLLDPDYYAIVDQKNPKRILHALEICYMTGKPYSSFRTNKKKERSFDIIKIGLRRDREELYERINKRVDEMIQNDLIDEVKNVMSYRYTNALNTVGYKEIFQYLDGNWSLEQAIEKIKQNTRIYSRKQMTWYKKDTEIHWFHPDNDKEIKKFLELVLND